MLHKGFLSSLYWAFDLVSQWFLHSLFRRLTFLFVIINLILHLLIHFPLTCCKSLLYFRVVYLFSHSLIHVLYIIIVPLFFSYSMFLIFSLINFSCCRSVYMYSILLSLVNILVSLPSLFFLNQSRSSSWLPLGIFHSFHYIHDALCTPCSRGPWSSLHFITNRSQLSTSFSFIVPPAFGVLHHSLPHLNSCYGSFVWILLFIISAFVFVSLLCFLSMIILQCVWGWLLQVCLWCIHR